MPEKTSRHRSEAGRRTPDDDARAPGGEKADSRTEGHRQYTAGKGITDRPEAPSVIVR